MNETASSGVDPRFNTGFIFLDGDCGAVVTATSYQRRYGETANTIP